MNVLDRIGLALKVLRHGRSALMTYEGEAETLAVKRIVAAASEVYGVSVLEILSKRRNKQFTEARHAAMLTALRHTRWGYSDIGRFFNRDHTSVLHAERKLSETPNVGLELRLELIKRKAKVA